MKVEWKTCFKIGITILLVIICVMMLPSAGNFLLSLLSASLPLLIGGAIAYLVNIIMKKYEKFYFPKTKKNLLIKSRRPVCMFFAYVSLFIVISLIVSLVLPELTSCIALILVKIPDVIKIIAGFLEDYHIVTDDVINYLYTTDWRSKISEVVKLVTSGIGNVLDVVIVTISSVFSGLVTALISVIFSIYLLSGKEKITDQYDRVMDRYVKPRITEKINHVLSTMNDCFSGYIVGQCTEALILGLLCTLGMMILKLPYATMIGALIAFTALIPVAGAYIGAIVGSFMILTVSPTKALIFLIFIVVLQQLEGNIIYPRVVGSSIGLPGIWVLAAITIAGGIMGIVGMLLGVPLAATAYKLLKEDVNRKKEVLCCEQEAEIEK